MLWYNEKGKTHRIVLYGMLVALASLFSYLESLFPFVTGLPGMKIGLANLVVVIAFYLIGNRGALSVSIVRIVFNAFTFQGLGTMIYSLAGGMLSFLVMMLAKKSGRFGVVGISIVGGVSHNVGQLMIAACMVSNLNMLYYFPALLVSGCIAGMGIGSTAGWILRSFHIKEKFVDNQKG